MSRVKKSRSLKRVSGGTKTGTKERMKLETKQRKAKKKAANPRLVVRQRSVFQKLEDEKKTPIGQKASVKKANPTLLQAPITPDFLVQTLTLKPEIKIIEIETETYSEEDLWDQLEQPKNSNTF